MTTGQGGPSPESGWMSSTSIPAGCHGRLSSCKAAVIPVLPRARLGAILVPQSPHAHLTCPALLFTDPAQRAADNHRRNYGLPALRTHRTLLLMQHFWDGTVANRVQDRLSQQNLSALCTDAASSLSPPGSEGLAHSRCSVNILLTKCASEQSSN